MAQNNGISPTTQGANCGLLSEMIRLGGVMSESQAMDYFVRLLDALQFVHASGKLHLNVTPSNVVVDNNGMIGLTNSRKNGDSYNPGYTPLEVMTTNAAAQGPWSDIYSAGATLYNMLTGKQPPKANDIISASNNAFDFAGVSRFMQQLICKMMSPSPKQRPQSVSDVWQLISNLPEDEQPSSAPQAPAIVPNMPQTTPAVPEPLAPAVPNVPASAPQPAPVPPPSPAPAPQPQPTPVPQLAPIPQPASQPAPAPQPIPVAPVSPPQQPPASSYYGRVDDEKKKSGSRLGLFVLGGVLIIAAIAGAAVMLWSKDGKTTDKIENTSEAPSSYRTDDPDPDTNTNTDPDLNTNSVANEEPANDEANEPNDVRQNYGSAAKEAQEREAEKKRKAEEEKKLKAEERNNQMAEQKKQQPNTKRVLDIAPVMPSFPKGDNKIMGFINSRKHNPTGETGFVVVQFVVNENGSLSNFKVVKSMSPEHDQEAMRVCKMLPNFNPGRDENGNPVNVRYTLPVRF